ncbi:MAG: acyltransferase family protein, partial [Acidimicrobiales bacterium]|nr:acyltransferase family protein [Acidimicrobiales bacterium]
PGVRTARRAIRRLAWVAAGGAAASGALMIGLSLRGASADRLYLGTDTRIAAILIGAFLACRQQLVAPGRRGAMSGAAGRRGLTIAGLAAASTLAVAWTRLAGTDLLLTRGGLLACSACAGVVLLDVTSAGPSPLRWVLSLAPLRWLGVISYGLYLWHWPIYQYLHPGWHGLLRWNLVAVRVGASLVVATISFVVLERPVRRGALGPWVVRTVTPVAVGLATVVLLLGTTGALDPTVRVSTGTLATTYSPGPTAAPKVLVVGDSVAFALATDALVPHAGELGLRVVDGARSGCSLMVDVGAQDGLATNCSPQWPALVARTHPDLVFVLFGALAGKAPRNVDGGKAWPCEPAYDRRWRARLDAAIDVLSAQGATVVLASAPTTTGILYKGEDPARFDERQQCANRVVAEAVHAHPNARLADLAAWTCPSWPDCRIKLDGVELRPDGLHFRGPGAQAPARWLAAQLRAIPLAHAATGPVSPTSRPAA